MGDQLGEIVAVMQERLNTILKQSDDGVRMAEGVHKLAGNVEALTQQMKSLAEHQDATTQRIESRMEAQGNRIGELELKPAHRWDDAGEKVIMAVIAAVVAFFLSRLGI